MQGLLRKMDLAELRARDWFGGMLRAQERDTVLRDDEFEDTDEEYDGCVVIPEVCTDDDEEKLGYDGYSEDDGEFSAFIMDDLDRDEDSDRDKSGAKDNGKDKDKDKGEDKNNLKYIKIINSRYQSRLDRLIVEYMEGVVAVLETILGEKDGEEYSGFPYRLLG